ncbi:MAG: ATP synthase subunit I [Armatimonadota bacterium]
MPVADEPFPRAYRTTVFLAVFIGLWLFCVWGLRAGLSFCGGALLGVLLLYLLDRAVNAIVGAPPGKPDRRWRLIYGPLSVLKYSLVGAALYHGFRLELIAPLPLAAGYTLAHAALVYALLTQRGGGVGRRQPAPSK